MDGYGPHENELRHLINNEGLAFIRKQIGIYLKELKEEFRLFRFIKIKLTVI
jgi:hypothetical protein